MSAWINRIGTAVPAHDIHVAFVAFAASLLPRDKDRVVFNRMAERSGIAHRFSHMAPGDLDAGQVDAGGFYQRGAFPGTAARMAEYTRLALDLALAAIGQLNSALDSALDDISHVIVASCTGFSAPGLDIQLVRHLGLRPDVGRTVIGFMGCSAAVPALRAADAIVRADPRSRVLVVNVELCSLHMQETSEIETALSFLLFGDGASAALVTAEPFGIALGDFKSVLIPDSADLITWDIGDQGFLMHLSGRVPGRIAQSLRGDPMQLLRGVAVEGYAFWAVHAGGRTVLDAVEIGLDLPKDALAQSRTVLHDFGNMSSATIMFVLARILAATNAPGDRGIGMAFGPGMVVETFVFRLQRQL